MQKPTKPKKPRTPRFINKPEKIISSNVEVVFADKDYVRLMDMFREAGAIQIDKKEVLQKARAAFHGWMGGIPDSVTEDNLELISLRSEVFWSKITVSLNLPRYKFVTKDDYDEAMKQYLASKNKEDIKREKYQAKLAIYEVELEKYHRELEEYQQHKKEKELENLKKKLKNLKKDLGYLRTPEREELYLDDT